MKGVILAGGNGTRLAPLTNVIGKQLIPVYDKPMIYYPLSTLIHAGVDDVLVISSARDLPNIQNLLGDGSKIGLSIDYLEQVSPLGLAHGLALAAGFISNEPFWFVLGDNLFHGPEFGSSLKSISQGKNCATILAYRVANPREYGVINFQSTDSKISSLEEKPLAPKSQWAIPGLYFFPNRAVEIAKNIKISERGEYEIIDVLKVFLESNQLDAKKISRGNTWLDLGSASNLLLASNFIETIQVRQGLLVGSPEEAAINSKLINVNYLRKYLSKMPNSNYYNSLKTIYSE